MSQTAIDGKSAVYSFLKGFDGCGSGVIADCLGMKQSDTIKILKQLENDGLVSRNPNNNKWRRLSPKDVFTNNKPHTENLGVN